jgi:uncharacterized protein YebE (UPF0316 family)
MKFLLTFAILSIVNVIFSTIRSITTIKSGKTIASLVSGGYFAFYNIVLLYTVADFPMWQKCLITFCCNVIGVWLVKWGEEKLRKDKLWLVKITIPTKSFDDIKQELEGNISFTYFNLEKYFVLDCYCQSKEETNVVLKLSKKYGGKSFATENRLP